jgi:hypothetical protein
MEIKMKILILMITCTFSLFSCTSTELKENDNHIDVLENTETQANNVTSSNQREEIIYLSSGQSANKKNNKGKSESLSIGEQLSYEGSKWLGNLVWKTRKSCTVSRIAKNWVLTAKHCTVFDKNSNIHPKSRVSFNPKTEGFEVLLNYDVCLGCDVKLIQLKEVDDFSYDSIIEIGIADLDRLKVGNKILVFGKGKPEYKSEVVKFKIVSPPIIKDGKEKVTKKSIYIESSSGFVCPDDSGSPVKMHNGKQQIGVLTNGFNQILRGEGDISNRANKCGNKLSSNAVFEILDKNIIKNICKTILNKDQDKKEEGIPNVNFPKICADVL